MTHRRPRVGTRAPFARLGGAAQKSLGTIFFYSFLATINLVVPAIPSYAAGGAATAQSRQVSKQAQAAPREDNAAASAQQDRKPPAHKTVVEHASWYGPGFNGRRTATGERFSASKLTAAARNLPLGSKVKVTNLHNGRSTVVKVNDCGPFRDGRKIDLSKRAAQKLGMVHKGEATVKAKVISKPPGATDCES
jgi:rare lipoprotein A (peptidoglycan hydrolase)